MYRTEENTEKILQVMQNEVRGRRAVEATSVFPGKRKVTFTSSEILWKSESLFIMFYIHFGSFLTGCVVYYLQVIFACQQDVTFLFKYIFQMVPEVYFFCVVIRVMGNSLDL